MAETRTDIEGAAVSTTDEDRRKGWFAAGGIVSAVLASSCCIVLVGIGDPRRVRRLDWQSDSIGTLQALVRRSDSGLSRARVPSSLFPTQAGLRGQTILRASGVR